MALSDGPAFLRFDCWFAGDAAAGAARSWPLAGVLSRTLSVPGIRGMSDGYGAALDACDQMGAQAYASGEHVAFKGSPDLHTAAHEAAHVVQQRRGVQLSGGVGKSGDSYERQADAAADAVVAGRSAADLLGSGSGRTAEPSVQQKQAAGGSETDAVSARFDAGTASVVQELIAQGVPEAEILAFLGLAAPAARTESSGTGPAGQDAVQKKDSPERSGGVQRAVQKKDSPKTTPTNAKKGGSDPFGLTLPGVKRIDGWKTKLILAALNGINPGLGALLTGAIVSSNSANVTIGIGPAVSGGAGGGFTLGAGIVIAPGGILGVYGSASANIGFFASISGTITVTVVKGGIGSFSGQSVGLTIGGGELLVGSVTLIFRSVDELMQGNVKPFGLAASVGIGAGLSPVEVFISVQGTGVANLEEIKRLQRKQ